jgi:hypothetical protein
MARQTQRFDDHNVESQGERSELRPHREKRFEGTGDAAALSRLQGGSTGREIGSRFDLDRRQHAPPLRYDIDLPRWAAPVDGKDAPAAESQMPAAQKLPRTAAISRFQAARIG